MHWWWSILCALLIAPSHAVAYDIIRDYSGSTFFDGWEFYGSWDGLTLGNVTWVTREVASSQNLAYVNGENHVIIRVDNVTNVPTGQTRKSVRITTQDAYDMGSLWIIDANHIPHGCSVWPAFWGFGRNWPDGGEIDIMENINLHTNNLMAVHTTQGCYHSGNTDQLGTTGTTDCSQGSGCTVEETSLNSYSLGFADAGGGVFATQFGVSGIFIWFWSRPDIPSSISRATSTSSMDISSWGIPSAAFSSNTCNISQFFTPQNLVLDIDLCGTWAGVPSIYGSQCAYQGSTGICYNDCVVGPGSPRYNEAYFDINYVRTYTAAAAAAVPGATGAPMSDGSPSSLDPQTSGSLGGIGWTATRVRPGFSGDVE
ncbi:concanavalin A-like lectin/glucanase domain-containing protein [Boletus coccyginus]|nr:concanavalin A-like lectin/glucanase domain-containing protein [Boletus coccyginus]